MKHDALWNILILDHQVLHHKNGHNKQKDNLKFTLIFYQIALLMIEY